MRSLLGLIILGSLTTPTVAWAQENTLKVVYPPANHETNTDKIFLLGTAPPTGQVLINNQPIQRSKSGHFAPSFPLEVGENLFTVRYQNQEIQKLVTRVDHQPQIPQGLAFVEDSLTPKLDISRLPGEKICFSAIASPNANLSVRLGERTVKLSPQPKQISLPSNSAIYIDGKNQPITQIVPGKYQGCTTLGILSDGEKPEFQLTLNNQTITQFSSGQIQTLSPAKLPVVEIIAEAGVARTGPSTTDSRLTPLPQGVRASVTAKEGDWLRLDYGGWIHSQETRMIPGAIPPHSKIRSIISRELPTATEIVFPLQVPVPVTVEQGDKTFTLTLHNTTAQTDTIRLDDNPLISRLDWQQIAPGKVQYTFNLKNSQQWGYNLQYRDTSLVLSLRHPPVLPRRQTQPLSGVRILLNAGHGGEELGAAGPTGYLAKDLNLVVTKLLRDELRRRGATVVMAREDDRDLSLVERQKMIDQNQPAIALTFHYRFLADDGDAENTKGVSSYWYYPQAHSLAVLLQNRLVQNLGRSSFGVYWNNLALTRPHSAPSVLLELGFMSNPDDFELAMDVEEQRRLARVLAEGVVEWFNK
ncbi:N-acetylmuramoyl-L-alanine amidase [Nodularia spumigena]|uniref:N-acetylmuramoyl-L-alanine amidase n=1 Tax=Nodularia spumigena UHCC 0060 TaxID=3110300 RepID=A0ABU5UVG8_NODSP|nr:N-acetylmuramoyl-L-alanine amidase [Nodularia spumigena]MEA5523986.1 N-acetylmuramoyl-L-alanine amidase [Nodularia spumigena UHCC 0143]MEA5610274.1 N-acetylmuramoyl-L-alanine amidase [Nodularia spumigena UHCC 0060]MEA5615856.1 N-acetylmuramoyl-L-alanine amidase [Nodularia spumigena UHCC 0040]